MSREASIVRLTAAGKAALPGVAAAVLLAVMITSAAALAQPSAMIEVPAGAFTMGSNDGPEDERPAHAQHLATFWIDRLPVTHAGFAAFLNATGPEGEARGRRYRRYDDDDNDARIARVQGRWQAAAGLESHPVNEVSWPGARDYCAWKGLRLPTEAEWEKAARGTGARRYPWGDATPSTAHARFGAGWTETAPVDAHPAGASPYGVLDLAGNNWEWVSSLYRPYPYRAEDGREDLLAEGVRGTRGGGHDSPAAELTATQRGRTLSRAPRAGHHNIGFRCAR